MNNKVNAMPFTSLLNYEVVEVSVEEFLEVVNSNQLNESKNEQFISFIKKFKQTNSNAQTQKY